MAPPSVLVAVGLGLALVWWPLRSRQRGTMRGGTAAICIAVAALPWLADRTSIVGLGALTLISAAALPVKLIDSAVVPQIWTARRWRDWASFMLLPFVVCFRGHLHDPVRPRAESVRLAVRGLIEMVAGALVLAWAFATDWSSISVVVEHVAKLVGLYLLALDGAFVFATGLTRLAGFPIHDLGRHPILATTPADFWRRYNRDTGRFIFLNLFRRLPMRSSAARILTVFVANGILHEYLAWIMCGRILGYQLAFFSLQGLATMLTARQRPTGARALLAWSATLCFMVASSALFFASVDAFVPWFQRR